MRPPASAASIVCAPPEKVIEPEMLPVAPAPKKIFIAFVPLTLNAQPGGTSRSEPAAPPRMSVLLAVPAWRFTVVPPVSSSRPIVSVGTPVTVTLPPPLNIRTSAVDGAVRPGLQLPATFHAPLPRQPRRTRPCPGS